MKEEKDELRKDIIERMTKRGNAIWSYTVNVIENESEEESYLAMCYQEAEASSFQKYCGKELIIDIIKYNTMYNGKPNIDLIKDFK